MTTPTDHNYPSGQPASVPKPPPDTTWMQTEQVRSVPPWERMPSPPAEPQADPSMWTPQPTVPDPGVSERGPNDPPPPPGTPYHRNFDPSNPPPFPGGPAKPKRSRVKLIVGLVIGGLVALFAIVVVATAGGDGGGGVATNPAVTAAPNPMPPISSDQANANSSAASTPTTDPSSDTGSSSSPAKIGDTVTYEDGIAVTVVSVKRVSFSDVSYGSRGTGVAVVVKVTNGDAETLDLMMTDVALTYGADGQESEQVFDSAKGIDSFDTKLAHGRSATAKYGFGVPRGVSAVSVQVTPDWSSETAIFEGNAS